MDKEIVFGGMTTTPSDYESPDGDLQLSVNCISEYGSIHPIKQPFRSDIVEDGIPIFVHKSPTFSIPHIIIQTTGGIKWRLSNSDSATLIDGTTNITNITSINSLGNWLILTANNNTHYIIFDENVYKYLGTHVPYPVVKISTDITAFNSTPMLNTLSPILNASDASVRVDGLDYIPTSTNTSLKFTDEQVSNFSDKLKSVLLSAIKNARDKGLFVFPRLIRVALRLYNGDYINFSEPVLVYNYSTKNAVICPLPRYNVTDKNYGDFIGSVASYNIFLNIENIELLKKWGSVISGIAIFSSSEIYDFNQEGVIDHLKYVSYNNSGCVYAEIPSSELTMMQQIESAHDFFKLYEFDLDDGKDRSSFYSIHLYHPVTNFSPDVFKEHTVTITFSISGVSHTETVNVEENDTINSIYNKISLALRKYNLDMYIYAQSDMPKKENLYTYDGLFTKELRVSVLGLDTLNITVTASEGSAMSFISCDKWGGFTLPSQSLPVSTLENQIVAKEYNGEIRPITANYLTNYNGREIYANIKKRLYEPSDISCSIQHPVLSIFYYLKIDGKTVVIEEKPKMFIYNYELAGEEWTVMSSYDPTVLFYPDSRCFKCVIKTNEGTTVQPDIKYYEIDLKKSDYMDASIHIIEPYLIGVLGVPYISVIEGSVDTWIIQNYAVETKTGYRTDLSNYASSMSADPTVTLDFTEALHSTIITSNALNPFSWYAINEQVVGTGNILGIATAAKPLSQGQSGQFPLYCFTDSEGVYSMSVSSSGALNPGQPILQEIPVDSSSIASLDDSVIFATTRGIIELTGSTQQLISADLHLKQSDLTPFEASLRSAVSQVTTLAETDVTDVTSLDCITFSDFIIDARFVYDYQNQRIIIFSETLNKEVFVYSRNTQKFSMLYLKDLKFQRILNAYPTPLFVGSYANQDPEEDDDIAIYSFSQDFNLYRKQNLSATELASYNPVDIYLLTRPLHLDLRDIHKTVTNLILRGTFDCTSMGVILYGSNDLRHWFPVKSSTTRFIRNIHGTPFKYFRIMVAGKFSDNDSLFSAQLSFNSKLDNKPR